MFSWKSGTNLKDLRHSEKQTGIHVVFFYDGQTGGCQASVTFLEKRPAVGVY